MPVHSFGSIYSDGEKYSKQNLYLDSSTPCMEGNYHSQLGSITIRGSANSPYTIKNAIALASIQVEHVIANGDLFSNFGSVEATHCSLKNITAEHLVQVSHTAVEGLIKSRFGNVEANQSQLKNVEANKNINVINSSALSLLSDKGSVTVKQTDGVKRIISSISARNKLCVENSEVNTIILHLDADQMGLIDLKNTEVTEKILVKVNKIFSISYDFFLTFSWPFYKFENRSIGFGDKNFTVILKGNEIPKNLVFEGFNANEITSQIKGDEIYIRGEKK